MAQQEIAGTPPPTGRDPLLDLQAIGRVADAVDRFELLDDVFDAALDELLASTSADRASILLFDDAGVMRFRAWRGLSDEYRVAVDGHSPWTPDDRDPAPVGVGDVLEDAELAPFRDTIAGEGIRALAFVPLVHRGRLIGKFMLYRSDPGAFDEVELELARAVGSLVAAAGERRRIEEALLASRGELEAILRQVADGITVQDAAGRLVYANDAAARLIGFDSAAELLTTPVEQLLAPFEMYDEAGAPFPIERLPGRLALSGVESEAVVRYVIRASGETRWSIVRATPIFDDAGEVRFAVNAFHEITARMESEARLKQLAATLDILLASAPVGLAFFDTSCRIVRINEALARMNNRPVEEHLGKTPHEVGSDLAPVTPFLEHVLETGRPVNGIEFHEGEPGRDRSFVANYYPVTADGQLLGVGVIVEETTARQREELRLRLLSEASETLASSLDYRETLARVARLLTTYITDAAAIWIEEGGSLVRVAHAHDEPELEALLDRLPATYDLRATPESPLVDAYSHGRSYVWQTAPEEVARTAARDAQDADAIAALAPKSIVVVPLLLGSRPVGVMTLSSATPGRHDENDRALAEVLGRRIAVAVDNARVYWEAEQRAQAAEALAFTGEGVCLLDNDGRVRLWNPAAAAITGLAERDVLGRKLVDVAPTWARVEEPTPGVSAQVVPVEFGGTDRWLSVSTARFAGGAVHAFRDLTHERALEQLKSDFISTVSHELRTPLAAIYGASMTLQRPDIDREPTQRATLLDVIATEAERLAHTINDVLWASRLESGTVHVRIERCDGVELAGDVVAAARTHLPKNLVLDFDVEESLPPVAADRDKVRQVLANLVDNAVKYSPEGGRIRVAVAARDRVVSFTVADEGLGIPAAEQERVFEKFYRLDPNLTRGVGGTGLGLYICRELVTRMEGRIRVDSVEGRGSTFVVELPVAA